ncbi:helix-turn-helix transcriptional regulator [Nonomuraea zeae]|uniref:PadR family transcriptional regulator n=1 Tax=Nonomuraea zeae TaxID=1642303 RepID=A0A5S4F4Q8_9ACTN|nr:helix-turn-helix transcriptional regulator [Nonomuraea zeae]TMR10959.1 PadR family transcriptional regulator [Nonomuraea zeae]
MYSDIVILRGLLRGPKHGYEIKKLVERITGGFLNNNTLYPALRRFEQRGEIEKVAEETTPGRPPRTVYRLTGRGRDRLRELLHNADPAVLVKDEEFQVRVGMFDLMDPEMRLRVIQARRASVEHSLASQEELVASSEQHPWGLRVLRFNIDRQRLELAWLDELATALEEPPDESPQDDHGR